ncbi:MAG: flagellar hook-length control protein FliK, partial [Burkholderiales bacterium]
MNTPAISTLLNGIHASTSGSPAAKQSGTTSDTQFNQMLSRGIEQRRALQEPTKPAAKESSPTKPATQSAQSPAKTSKADSGEEGKPASVDETASAAAVEDAPASAAAVEQSKTSSASGDSEDDEAAFAASSDELLALVANLTAVLPANVPVQAPAAEVVQVDADATDRGKAVLPSDVQSAVAGMAAPVGKADLTAHASLTALRNRVASDATASDTVTSEKPGTKPEFELAMAEAQPRNAKVTADPGPALARSAQAELAAATASDVDPFVKTTVDTQPAAAPIPSINVAPQPQVSLLQVQAATAAAADKIAPRVGSNGWDQAVAQKVVWMVAGEQQSASLTLNPP